MQSVLFFRSGAKFDHGRVFRYGISGDSYAVIRMTTEMLILFVAKNKNSAYFLHRITLSSNLSFVAYDRLALTMFRLYQILRFVVIISDENLLNGGEFVELKSRVF